MDQQEIQKKIDELITQSETVIEEVFARRLKELLYMVSDIYRKYTVKGKDPSYTDLNKYNRLQKELELIKKTLNADYRAVVKTLESAQETIYIQNYLMAAYLLEMTAEEDMGFSLPSMETIQEAILSPIEFLTLPKVMENHRNELIRRIHIEITQGFIAGEGYANIAQRLQKALGFSQKKARLVARTEGGRTRSISSEAVAEQASKHTKLGKVWMSSLDLRVRMSHRALDGKKADAEGYFHYKGLKAKAPLLWGNAPMDIQCRCDVLYTVNGMLPQYRRGRNYMDEDYQKKLKERVNKYMDEGKTFLQAFKKADKEIKPPSKVFDYVTYDDWKDKFATAK
ncbi:SPP1 gp7 family putative phage head morphogenesis protein [Psychrobacillus insolitus]|uniref:SPP1 gp7 family putative phage head morphogenesis protein n=1 Tax=Psychrobacillus insolitus TaxID=1461 RepID=A0A2W7MMB4_9BACI|nr:phage minor head protein [Psychrobacillus insolitus]PZX07910.1 SPP1 gp7 family putative phage head morphogenesis protein [Psychrobacillus insolitus]